MNEIAAIYLVLLVPCLLLSAFFSGSEAAFLSLRKVRIRRMVEEHIVGADRISQMIEQPGKVLPTILLGNNLANTAFAAIATLIMVSLIGEGQGVIVATIATTIVLLVLGETLPKTMAIRHAESLFFLSSKVLLVMEIVLFPLILLLQSLNRLLTRGIGNNPRALFTEEEIKTAISIGLEAGEVEEQEAQMLENVFRFGDRQLREIMTPRTEVIWVEAGTTLSDFMEIYQTDSHSRFPVFEEHVDNVIGLLWIKDVMTAIAKGIIKNQDSITHLLRPVAFTPDTKLVGTLFREMQSVSGQMAMAVDEFGGIAGLTTQKQLIEEIVGPVGEEGKEHEFEYETIDENTFNVEAGMQIEEVNEELDLNLPSGNYETVAGFILDVLGHIPVEGEHVQYDNLRLLITDVKGMRIEKVTVVKGNIVDRD